MKKKIILYTTEDGNVPVSVRFEDEDFWMTQKAIAELFETDRSVITKHISNIYSDENSIGNQPVQNLHRFKPRVAERLHAH